MARSQRRRYMTSIIVMLLIVGGLWTTVALGCTTKSRTAKNGATTTECKSPMKPQLGLDLQGGISVVLAPKNAVKRDALEKAVEIIRQRIDAFGVAEPDVSLQGNNIILEIPGLKDRERALQVIGQTAELRMRPVLSAIQPGSKQWQSSPPANCRFPFLQTQSGAPPSGSTVSSPSPSPKVKSSGSKIHASRIGLARTASKPAVKPAAKPTGKATPKKPASINPAPNKPGKRPKRPTPLASSSTGPSAVPSAAPAPSGGADDPSRSLVLCSRAKSQDGKDIDPRGWEKLQLGPASLVGADVAGATAKTANSTTNVGWEVELRLTSAGAKKFGEITGQLACNPQGDVKRQLAIELDGVVESHPQMGEGVKCKTGIADGTAVITGTFTEKEAKNLALVLRFGALPVALVPQETNEISPTLGHDSLQGGLLAGAIGLALTLLYVLLFYRILGAIVWFGLALHASFTLAVVIILGSTVGFSLSLAGIAGLIVSIGIAADSFIVYFERIKDEVHTGKSIRSSVDRAWSSAWRTIVAADLVTALAAAALYLLAVGGVRGFALMLGLATALDLFVSYLVMHPLVWLLSQTKFFNQSKRFGIKRVVGGASPALAGGAK